MKKFSVLAMLLALLACPVAADTPPPPNNFMSSSSAAPPNPSTGKYKLWLSASDQTVYVLNDAGTSTAVGKSGIVVGPASATDTALSVFDGTTGKLLKNSTLLYKDSANLYINSGQLFTDAGKGHFVNGYGNSHWAFGKDISGNTTPHIAGEKIQIMFPITSNHGFSIGSDSGSDAAFMEIDSSGKVWFAGDVAVAGSLTGALTGNASTATALAANPTDCASNTYATTIAANGNLTCASITNASTTAVSTNTPSTLVLRDGSGNFSAGTITAALTGNSSTSTALAANPTDCGSNTYATTIDASGNLTCASITNASTTGTSTNTISTLVLRDGSGNFSAGTITAALTGNSSTSTALAANPTDCGSNTYATTIDAGGNLTCASITNASTTGTASNTNGTLVLRDGSGNFAAGTITASLTGAVTGNASTATALAANPTDCGSNTYATTIDANGNLTCASITNASTTAVSTNTPSTIALRDASGNFSAGTITAALTGNSSTATALAANPTDCGSNTYATTIDASGNLTCASITNASTTAVSTNTNSTIVLRDGSGNFAAGTITASLTGAVTGNASTATALAANPTDCSANQFATTIDANGNLTCAQPAFTNLTGTATIAQGGTNNGSLGVTAGSMYYGDGSKIISMGAGTAGQVPVSTGTAVGWGTPVGGNFANLITNGDFSNGTTGWTSSGGTFTTVSNGANYMGVGLNNATWDSSAAAQTLTSPAYTVSGGYAGTNGLYRCKVWNQSGATQTMGVWDGSTLTSTIAIDPTITAKYVEVMVPFGAASTTTAIRFTSVASNEPLISVADCYVGPNFNIGTVSQSILVGESYFAGTTSCSWSRTSTTVGAFSTSSTCPGPTVVRSYDGIWATTDVDLPIQTVNNLPPGVYEATFQTRVASAAGAAVLAINDGTTTCEAVPASEDTTFNNGNSVTCSFEYTASGNHSFQLYGANTSGAININNATTAPRGSTKFTLKRYPTTAQSAVRVDQSNFGWTSYTPTFVGFGTTTNVNIRYRKNGSNLEIMGSLTAGTPTGVTATMTLPNSLIAASNLRSAAELVGHAVHDGSTSGLTYSLLAKPSDTVLYFGLQAVAAGTAGLLPNTGSVMFNVSDNISINASVPIQGWTENGSTLLITGSSGTGGLVGDRELNPNPTVDAGITGYIAYADAAGVQPVDGTGGSPNTTCTYTTSSPITGAGALLITKSGSANRQGEGCAITSNTLSGADTQPNVEALEFDYKVVSGTFTAGSDLPGSSVDSDYEVYAYDIANSNLIQVSPKKLYSNVAGHFYGTFQTSINATTYRLILHNATTTTNNFSFQADNISFHPAKTTGSVGPVVWTGTQSSQAVTANVTNIAFTTTKDSAGAWNGTQYAVPYAGDYVLLGGIQVSTTGATVQTYVNGSVYAPNGIWSTGPANPSATSGAVVLTNLKAGDLISIRCNGSTTLLTGNLGIYMISGSTSGSSIPNPIVAASAHVSSAASTTTATPFNFDTVDNDTNATITTGVGTWKFTCPVPGYYNVSSFLFSLSAATNFFLYKNGSIFRTLVFNNNTSQPSPASTIVLCNAGDTLDLRPGTTVTPGAVTGATIAQSAWISIFLVQGASSASGIPLPLVLSQTTTYSATVGDYVYASGASYPITLPTAAGVKGREITIEHAGTSFTNVYTLNTTSSQTIGGIASGSYALYTAGEVLTVVSDGSNWRVQVHKTNASGTYTPTFSAAWGTVTNISFNWRREGEEIFVRGTFTVGTRAASIATVTLPGGLNIDSTKIAANTSANPGPIVGQYRSSEATANAGGNAVTATSTSTALIYFANSDLVAASHVTPANGDTVTASSVTGAIEFHVPLLGFQP